MGAARGRGLNARTGAIRVHLAPASQTGARRDAAACAYLALHAHHGQAAAAATFSGDMGLSCVRRGVRSAAASACPIRSAQSAALSSDARPRV